MSGFSNRNVLLLAAFIAVVAGVLFFARRPAGPIAEAQLVQPEANVSPQFATVRSAHHTTAEQSETQHREEAWQQALDAADRCSAMSANIRTGDDAQQAMRWAKSIDDEAKRKTALDAILCAWIKFDPQKAVSWTTNGDENATSHAFALTSAFESWATQDPKSASAFATTLGQADQTYAIAAVAPKLADQNPQDAIQWAQGFTDEDARNLATQTVVDAWSRNEPADAAAWVAAQPESFDRADNVRAILQRWLESDATAAVEWVGTLPAGTSRDGALDLIASKVVDTNPSAAALWGQSIDRMELRDARLQSVAGKWLSTDPDAARNWLDKAPLPDSTKLQLTAPQSPILR